MKRNFKWTCKHTWKRSAYNTLWCLIGCSIGDFGTIMFFQFSNIVWPTFYIMILAIINGLITSVILETSILLKQMNFSQSLKTALGMSFISMISMESGAKKTNELIPLCHPLSLDHISLHTEINDEKHSIIVYCLVSANSKTGVEMEALSGVSSALLTIYDLSKIVEPNLKIINTKLLIKSGGKAGLWTNPDGIPEKIKNILKI